MSCPHCGYLLSPLDIDCVRCRQRGCAPPVPAVPDAYHPVPNPGVLSSWFSPALVVSAVGTLMLLFLMLGGFLLGQQRYQRQEAALRALNAELVLERQHVAELRANAAPIASGYFQIQKQMPAPQTTIVMPQYQPASTAYGPFPDHLQMHHQRMQNMLRRQDEDMQRMQDHFQAVQDHLQSINRQAQQRLEDRRDPFNPYHRF